MRVALTTTSTPCTRGTFSLPWHLRPPKEESNTIVVVTCSFIQPLTSSLPLPSRVTFSTFKKATHIFEKITREQKRGGIIPIMRIPFRAVRGEANVLCYVIDPCLSSVRVAWVTQGLCGNVQYVECSENCPTDFAIFLQIPCYPPLSGVRLRA